MTKFVIYKNDDEIIVTTAKSEDQALAELFDDKLASACRSFEDYERFEQEDSNVIISALIDFDFQ